MTSGNKAEANHHTAQKRIGPKTLEGKTAVRPNTLRHCLRSRKVFLPGGDEQTLQELDERPRAALQLVG